jgi:ATP-dependent Lon protease
MLRFPDGTVRFLIQGLSRIKVKKFTGQSPYLMAEVEELEEQVDDTVEMEALQRRRILQALSSADWNKNHAAKRLGLKRTTLLAKMKRLGISR